MEAQLLPDKLQQSDIDALKPLVGQESRELVFEKKVGPDLYLRKEQVTDEIFDFDTGEGQFFRFNVRWIKDAIVDRSLSCDVFTAEVPESLYNHIVKNQGVEEERIARLTGADLKRPAIVVLFPDNRSVIIDGNHRIVGAWRKGQKEYRFIGVSLEQVIKGGLAWFGTKPFGNWLGEERKNGNA